MAVARGNDGPVGLSAFLLETSSSFGGPTTTVRDMLEKVGERGMLVMSIVLCVPFLVPVSIPGVSTIFGFAITLAGLAVSAKRLPWLPKRMLRKEVSTERLKATFEAGARKVARLEKLVRPRLTALTAGKAVLRLNGLLLAWTGLLLMAPFGLIPFSNTLPALAAMFLAIGLLYRDGAFVLLGYATTVGTMVYFGFLIGGAVYAGNELRSVIGG